MATDYKVRFRSYRAVAEFAHEARKRMCVAHYFTFNIVKAIRRLVGKEFGKLGVLHLDVFERDNDPVAFVTFNWLTLHVHRESGRMRSRGSRNLVSSSLMNSAICLCTAITDRRSPKTRSRG